MSRLFVLGALRAGPRHGYLIRREAVVDQTESWADIKAGSIYNALHRMVGEGLVEPAAVEQDAGPARTVYAITVPGRAEMRDRLRRILAEASLPPDPFDVALRLADELPEEEVAGLLQARKSALADRLEKHRSTLVAVRHHLTTWELQAFEHVIARLSFELDWTTQLLADRSERP